MGGERQVILFTSRVLSFFFGAALLLFAVTGMLIPRAKFVSSTPQAGSSIVEPPTAVIVNFTNKLSPDSRIDVVSTMRLSPAGDLEQLAGRSVVIGSGINAADPGGKSMLVELRPGLHKGLYFVNWRTKAAGWGSITYGNTQFAVGMAVPEFITRDSGIVRERNNNHRGYLAAFIGGVVLLALAFALPVRNQ